jgi:hypothetical protein
MGGLDRQLHKAAIDERAPQHGMSVYSCRGEGPES